MKRVALLTVFFYVCTFAAPQRAQAVVPVAVIAAAAIGTAMASAAAGSYYAKTGQYPEYVTKAADGVASAIDVISQPAYAAIGPLSLVTVASFPAAASVYLGKDTTLSAPIGSFLDHVKNSAANAYTGLKSVIADATPATMNLPDSDLPVNSILTLGDGTKIQITEAPVKESMAWAPSTFDSYMLNISGVVRIPGWTHAFYHSSQKKIYAMSSLKPNTTQNWIWTYGCSVVNTGDAVAPPAGQVDYTALKNKYGAASDAVKKEAQDAMKDMPADKVNKADNLTQSEANDALKKNTADVAQKAADTAAELAAANPTDVSVKIAADQAAVEAAKAQEEAAKEEPTEETFSPISDSAFVEPYNPGEFDIPARFTTFLNNVKSSGLFSFSNDFFNSLPGGGSPIFEIEGGIFGSHRIDLSETMSGGLAVLKTVLLALFGFLSIRAVIMKR
jgi:hypothetical protein